MSEPPSMPPPAVIRLVIADDHALLRAGLRRILKVTEGMALVGEAQDGAEAMAAITATGADVLLLDLHMPRTATDALLPELRARFPRLRTIIMTGYDDTATLRAALAAGAAGIVLKDSGFAVIRDAIQSVAQGRLFVDPSLHLEPSQPAASELTPREQEILVLLARGASYRDVAQRLAVGERTVETHRRRIADKLGLRTRAELTEYALRAGLVDTAGDRLNPRA